MKDCQSRPLSRYNPVRKRSGHLARDVEVNRKVCSMDWQPQDPWYHGSPLKLSHIRAGSSITPKRALARIFSHKPSIVSVEDDGAIRHNGILPGYLYTIDEPILPGDIEPHPRTTMKPGDEWLTTRELRLHLLCQTEPLPAETLSAQDIEVLKSKPAHG